MSLQDPSGKPNPLFGSALAGACIAVVLSVPAAAFAASLLGDTYRVRALIYCGFLFWAVAGAVVVYLRTWRSEREPLSATRILLWFASVWLWPLLLAGAALARGGRR